jgi:hypothetical protein
MKTLKKDNEKQFILDFSARASLQATNAFATGCNCMYATWVSFQFESHRLHLLQISGFVRYNLRIE